MISKADTIEAIRTLNHSVSAEFLTKFSYKQLRAYLTRLQDSAATQREIEIDAASLAHPSLLARSGRAIA